MRTTNRAESGLPDMSCGIRPGGRRTGAPPATSAIGSRPGGSSGAGGEEPRGRARPLLSPGDLGDRLAAEGIVGISGIDTRALTRHLRSRGAMRVGISSVDLDPAGLLARVRQSPEMLGADLSAEVSTPERYTVEAIGEHRYTVAAL